MKKKSRKKKKAIAWLGAGCLSLLVCVVGWSGWANAATQADWDRNSEVDMLQYRIYTCAVKGCTATKGVTPTATVAQTGTGVRPSWPLPANAEGALVVTAVDTSNNESGASVSVPFDTKPPAVPTGVQTD